MYIVIERRENKRPGSEASVTMLRSPSLSLSTCISIIGIHLGFCVFRCSSDSPLAKAIVHSCGSTVNRRPSYLISAFDIRLIFEPSSGIPALILKLFSRRDDWSDVKGFPTPSDEASRERATQRAMVDELPTAARARCCQLRAKKFSLRACARRTRACASFGRASAKRNFVIFRISFNGITMHFIGGIRANARKSDH